MKKVWVFLGIVIAGTFLVSCVSTQVVNSYMDKDLPVREHAMLVVDPKVAVHSVYGELKIASWANQVRIKTILLIPGKHSLSVSWLDTTSGRGRITTDSVIISGEFLSGRVYRLTGEEIGDSVIFRLVEDSDKLDLWNSKEVTSVKPPNKGIIKYDLVLERAAGNVRTELEGTWRMMDIPEYLFRFGNIVEMEYIFTGSSYIVAMISNSGKIYNAYRGTFTVNGNSIIATLMQQSIGDLETWRIFPMNMGNTTYEFSYSLEGNLLLLRRGREGMAFFPISGNPTRILTKKR